MYYSGVLTSKTFLNTFKLGKNKYTFCCCPSPPNHKFCYAPDRYVFLLTPLKVIFLHQSTATSTFWYGPRPRLGGVETAIGFSEGPNRPGHSSHTNHFSPCCPLNDRRRVAGSLSEIDRLFSLSCLSHTPDMRQRSP